MMSQLRLNSTAHSYDKEEKQREGGITFSITQKEKGLLLSSPLKWMAEE
ncbi:hypothetical protein SAMN02982996_01365 [Lonsdalea quercina]|uniref:Uncharacterized protein n=2 Tax=Lonsdalea quercina TaxID=71657 RepID=A0A1H3ZYW6_9GAMM|nr:hypothetical protein SAMN02982996_01365 [Lonsdalea quercina]